MIKIEKLCKTYGDFKALKGLSLEIPDGELFCFLGPNGAGKTTTIKILTGLLHPTSGSAAINGLDILQDSLRIKQDIGYIPDTPYLYDRLTTVEFFYFTGRLYNIDKEKIDRELDKSFELFGLNEHRGSLIKELSHGLRQRLIYAVTFLHNPSVLFVDEPFVGLDPYTIRLIKDLLKKHTAAGGTILLTTHILAIAEDIADRIGIIHRGELAASGTPAELRAKYAGVIGVGNPALEDIFLHITADGRAG